MGGIIDFNTDCPWELYLFAFVHIIGAVVMYVFDSCSLLTDTPCTDQEKVMSNIVALSMLYVGVLYTVLTYHNKTVAAKVTRLSDVALTAATALLVSVVFAGNASFPGGVERSWMHKGDMITMIIVVAVLWKKVTKNDAEWAQKISLEEGMGLNCKTLLALFSALTLFKFVAYTDFISPVNLFADDSSEMTAFANWMWKFTSVLIFEVFLAILYTVVFDDDAGHELVVITIMVMSVVAGLSISTVQKYMSTWMGLNSHALWIRLGILLLVCLVAIVGGRRSNRSGYQTV